MPKPPTFRGFTIAEARSLNFERVTLWMVLLVSVIAAIASFFALAWAGRQFMGPVGYLLPIAVDGFGLSCSVSIVRSQSDGEGWRDRINEWVGLWLALGLSVAGNIAHALDQGTGVLPPALTVAFATAIPVIVAYGIHVYCRALGKGVSSRVMVDSPDQIRDDVTAALVSRPAAPTVTRRAPERAPAARPESAHLAVEHARAATARAPRPATAEGALRGQQAQAAMRALFDELVAADPSRKPVAADMARQLGVEAHPATPRGWVKDWWDEVNAAPVPTAPTAPTAPAGAERESAAA